MSGNGPKSQMGTVAKPERVKKIQNVTSQSKGVQLTSGNGPMHPPSKRG